MYDARNTSAFNILRQLQKLVKSNTARIRSNNRFIKKNIKNGTLDEMNDVLNRITFENKNLADENTQYMELHTRLLCFLKAISKKQDPNMINNEQKPEQYHIDDYLEKTVSGELKYNRHHPLYNNKQFRHMLIEYYSVLEEYEICAELLRI